MTKVDEIRKSIKEGKYETAIQMEAAIRHLLGLVDRMGEVLKYARETIHVWHGDIAWDLYQSSPEMKRINAILKETGGWVKSPEDRRSA